MLQQTNTLLFGLVDPTDKTTNKTPDPNSTGHDRHQDKAHAMDHHATPVGTDFVIS